MHACIHMYGFVNMKHDELTLMSRVLSNRRAKRIAFRTPLIRSPKPQLLSPASWNTNTTVLFFGWWIVDQYLCTNGYFKQVWLNRFSKACLYGFDWPRDHEKTRNAMKCKTHCNFPIIEIGHSSMFSVAISSITTMTNGSGSSITVQWYCTHVHTCLHDMTCVKERVLV